jgi:hypothetical protein
VFRKKKQNLLTMTPVLKETYTLEPASADSEKMQVVIPRDSWLERLSIRFLKQPDRIKVKLDELGSFVLSHCNGDYTVEEIADRVEAHFGEEAEPVLPRLVKFLQIVEANGWIHMQKAQ